MPSHNLVIERVPVERLSQHPDNANNGDVDAIAESIEINGVYRPIIAQHSTGHVVAGNHTYLAQLKLGATEVDVVWLYIDDEQAKRIMLADNQTARRGMDDEAQLYNLLDELRGTDLGLAGTGFEYRDLEYLEQMVNEPLSIDDITADEAANAAGGADPRHRLGFTITPTVDEDGNCESITLSRPNLRPITLTDFIALRKALGMDPMSPLERHSTGVPAWDRA